MRRLFAIALTFAMISSAALAAPAYFGISGNILTPDDTILATGEFSANLHQLQLDDNSPLVIGASVGAAQNLELGFAYFDPDVENADSSTLINAKYSLLPETERMPSLAVGAVDLTGELDVADEDPSFFVVIGKNLTPVATDVYGEPSAPIRGMVGFGGGMYDGFFAALDWTLTPKVSAVAEYISGDEGFDGFNAGVRLAITNNLRIDAALIDGEDMAFGISFTQLAY